MEAWNIVLQLLTPAILMLLGALLKRTMSSMDERMNRQEGRIERLEQDTVSKEDWLRESALMRQRQEKTLEQLAEIKGQTAASLEITAAIKAQTAASLEAAAAIKMLAKGKGPR